MQNTTWAAAKTSAKLLLFAFGASVLIYYIFSNPEKELVGVKVVPGGSDKGSELNKHEELESKRNDVTELVPQPASNEEVRGKPKGSWEQEHPHQVPITPSTVDQLQKEFMKWNSSQEGELFRKKQQEFISYIKHTQDKFSSSDLHLDAALKHFLQYEKNQEEVTAMISEFLSTSISKSTLIPNIDNLIVPTLGRNSDKDVIICEFGWLACGHTAKTLLELSSTGFQETEFTSNVKVLSFSSFLKREQCLDVFEAYTDFYHPNRYVAFHGCSFRLQPGGFFGLECAPSHRLFKSNGQDILAWNLFVNAEKRCDILLMNEAIVELQKNQEPSVEHLLLRKTIPNRERLRTTFQKYLLTAVSTGKDTQVPEARAQMNVLYGWINTELDFLKFSLEAVSKCSTDLILVNSITRDYYRTFELKAHTCCEYGRIIKWDKCGKSAEETFQYCFGEYQVHPTGIECSPPEIFIPTTVEDLAKEMSHHCLTFDIQDYHAQMQMLNKPRITADRLGMAYYMQLFTDLLVKQVVLPIPFVGICKRENTKLSDEANQVALTLPKLDAEDYLYSSTEEWRVLPFTSWPEPDPSFSRPLGDHVTVAICTMIRNEGYYMEEWLRYYFWLGVEHITIMNHHSDDFPERVVQAFFNSAPQYRDRVRIISHNDPHKHYLGNGYTKCLHMYSKNNENMTRPTADWVGIIDLDEFVALNLPNDKLPNYLKFISRTNIMVGCVSFRWMIFTPSGHFHAPTARSQIRTFTRNCHYVLSQGWEFSNWGKLFCRPETILAVDATSHFVFFYTDQEYQLTLLRYSTIVNAKKNRLDGDVTLNRLPPSPNRPVDEIYTSTTDRSQAFIYHDATKFDSHWLIHFQTRSFEDFLMKCLRRQTYGENPFEIDFTYFYLVALKCKNIESNFMDYDILYQRFYLRNMKSPSLISIWPEYYLINDLLNPETGLQSPVKSFV